MPQPLIAFVFNNASQFKAVTAGGQMCTPDIVVFDTNGGEISIAGTLSSPSSISLPPPGKPDKSEPVSMYTASSAQITVTKDKSPQLQFVVCDNTGANASPPVAPSYTSYLLCGIAMRNDNNGNRPDVSRFPGFSVLVDNGITELQQMDDNSHNNRTQSTYEFYLVVQNASGDIGLIDPKIINQPT
jgi:hypothetical protein